MEDTSLITSLFTPSNKNENIQQENIDVNINRNENMSRYENKIKKGSIEESKLWHKRLGHLNRYSMKQLNNLAEEYYVSTVSNEPCEICLRGTHSKLPFHSNPKRVNELLELVHTDLCGPMEVISIGGNRYFLTFIDDHSRYTTVYILKSKDEVKYYLETYKNMAEKRAPVKTQNCCLAESAPFRSIFLKNNEYKARYKEKTEYCDINFKNN